MSFGFGFSLPAILRKVAGYDPFNQSGPTLDLVFAGVATDLDSLGGYTLTTDFIVPQYQIAAQYTVWENGMGLVSKSFSDIITFSRASTATYFDSAGVLQSAANNAPRFDYNPSTLAAQGLLIEEQRTNLLLQSEDFATTWAATGSTVSVNAITAPSGAATADKLIADSGVAVSSSSVSAFVRQDITKAATATTYTFSVFAKADEFNAIRLFARDDATSANNAAVSVLLTNGTVLTAAAAGGTFTNADKVITPVGNGWYRVALIFTSFTETAIRCIYAVNDSSATTGDGTKGIYVWGAQLEVGAFPTSYIPTTVAQVTRQKDEASVNTLSPWYNAAEGTLFAEGTVVDYISGTTARVFGYFANTPSPTTDIFSVEARSSTSTRARILTGGVTVNASDTVDVLGVNAKLAGAYGSDGATICVNGGSPVTLASSLPTVNVLALGQNTAGTTASFANGYLRRITYYPRRLSNAELQAITS